MKSHTWKEKMKGVISVDDEYNGDKSINIHFVSRIYSQLWPSVASWIQEGGCENEWYLQNDLLLIL